MSEAAQQELNRLIAAGATHYARREFAEAEAITRMALELAPRSVAVIGNLGAILRAAGRHGDALALYVEALSADPQAVGLWINRANVLNDLQRPKDAEQAAEEALRLTPGHVAALNALGNAQAALGKWEDASVSYAEAAKADPGFQSLYNLANLRLRRGDATGALAAYAKATEATPTAAELHLGQGMALAALGRWADALRAYDRAFELNPNLPFLAGYRASARMRVCDWRDFDQMASDLLSRVDQGQPATLPFTLVGLPATPAQQLRAARTYCDMTLKASPRPRPAPARRIRVGYFSADLQDHPTGYLAPVLFELHDRERFEVTAFSFGRDDGSAARRRLEAATERFIDVEPLSPAAIRDRAVGLGLDIAVDLMGFTRFSRPEIFARGVAPVQVNFLGFPMTTGAPFMDYIVADPVVITLDDAQFYTERIAWLANCYQPNDPRRAAALVGDRRTHGLAQDAFVLACFNTLYKITPEVFAIWMDLLRAEPAAVLWLLDDGDDARANLGREAEAAGVDRARLIFAPRRPMLEHLARLGHADLFVDTFPCAAHTTASDALWAGLPLLTRTGETFASRVASSLLAAINCPELIAKDAADYRQKALRLMRDRPALSALRRRVEAARATSRLFDMVAYTRGIEDLYREMYRRSSAGLPADHIGPLDAAL